MTHRRCPNHQFPRVCRSSGRCLRTRWRPWIPTMQRQRRSEAIRTWRAVWPALQHISSSCAWRLAMRRSDSWFKWCVGVNLPMSFSGCFFIFSMCQVLKKIAKYIQEQNEKIYAPRGLLITDPIERGMRVVSLTCEHISSIVSVSVTHVDPWPLSTR